MPSRWVPRCWAGAEKPSPPPFRSPRRAEPGAPLHRLAHLSLAFALLVGGCAYTFDEAGTDVTLVGDPIPPSQYPQLNAGLGPARTTLLIQGAAATPDRDDLWVAMAQAQPETWPPPEKWPDTFRLFHLSDETVETWSADQILPGGSMLYLLNRPSDGKGAVQLTLRRPGVGDPIGNFALPPGDGLLLAAANDTAFAYIPAKGDKGTFLLRRSDGSFARELPLPAGVDAKLPFDKGRFYFEPRGEFFFSQDAESKLVAHSTMSNTDRPLGTFDRDVILDSRTRTLYFCGMRGLVRLSIASPTPQTLDGSPCNPSILRLSSGSILYLRQDGLREISESGVARLLVPAPIGQLLAVGPNGSLVYSSDPPLTYGAGIGDGWIGDWRFMNRGRRPTYSIDAADPANADRARIRWQENAARSDNSGELMSARLAARDSERPLLLAKNVRQWLEVRPGRLYTIANAAGRGVYNRMIVIDEDKREAQWVIDSARDFLRVPGQNVIIALVVHGQIGFDVYRVPIL
jgi:hypothetical protein